MSDTPALILIVDDEVTVRKLLQMLLHSQGYHTLTASSGKEALALIARQPPDLILLDIMMPGMDGYEVASQLKAAQSTSSIPIIMLSALGEHSARLLGLEAGAEDFLSKPVDSAELWLKVRNLLRLKSFSDFLKSHSLILEEQLLQRTIDLERFRAAMDTAGDAIFLIERSSMRLIEFNRGACELLGYTSEELLLKTPEDLSGCSTEELEQLYDQIIQGSGPCEPTEIIIRAKSGEQLPVDVHRQAYKSGEKWIVVSVARDVSQRKETDQRILKMAHYDSLTGLPNRGLFITTLEMGLTQAAISGWRLVLVTVDLDAFKQVNETWGHLQGDQLLAQLSQRLSECLDVSDTLGRMDGDEFALILMIREGQVDVRRVVEHIRDQLRAPFLIGGQSTCMTASFGIAVFPQDAAQADTLFKRAHTAMNLAKKTGGDTYRFYTAQMHVEAAARLDIETALRDAVERQGFELFYQPKICTRTGEVSGLEALLRWPRPGLANISPAVFVPILESLGLISEVGRWVIASACSQIARWQRAGVGPYKVAVNVSGDQIIEGDLIAHINNAVTDNHIDPCWLEVELTESSLMENTAHTITSLQALRDLGVTISIDDFGTGYSSLAYLRRFPISTLKIDIAFIREVTTSAQDAAIVRTIIELAHSLDMQVIAEGVETPEQLAFLTQNGCDQVQGYLFSKPLAIDELTLFLRGYEPVIG
jgi:diguanylate cyclase (GGDEF)-like protein/PAS domain S-box-containing protein